MSRKIILTIAAAAALSQPLCAQNSDLIPQSFSELARTLVYGSPSSDLLMIEGEARRAENSIQGNLPDPTIEGEFLVPQTSGESNRWGVSADWSLEWPGVYSARREQAQRENEALQAESMAAINRRVLEVQSILIEMKACDNTWNCLNEILRDTDSIASHVERARQGGEVSRIDVSKLRVERARLLARMDRVSVEIADLRKTLISDYGIKLEKMPPAQYMRLELQPLEYYLEQYDTSSLAAGYRASALAAETAVKVARRESLPGIGIGYRHAYEDANHFNGAALSLSVPIFSSKGKKKAAELRAFTTASEERIARENISAKIGDTYHIALQLKENLAGIEAPIKEGLTFDLLRRAYEGGEWTLVQYLQERAYYLEAALDLIEIERAYNQAVTSLSLY